MRISFHGGFCCGVKVINGLGVNPKQMLYDVLEKTKTKNQDVNGEDTLSSTNFFTDSAPVETYLARLDRYLAFIDKYRPNGIVEITLAQGSFMKQVDMWGKILEARGFKEVTSCFNSNSRNRVHIYHRCTDK